MFKVQMKTDTVTTAFENLRRNLPKEFAIVNGKTAKRGRSITAKEVTQELAVTQKVVRQHTKVRKKDIASILDISKSKRMGLRHFKARQTKKGVSYRISKTKGRKFIPSAFQGPAPGRMNVKWKGNVFKRKGKARLPLVHVRGPSPWGVVLKGKKLKPIIKQMQAELSKQARERIRYLKLKRSGAI